MTGKRWNILTILTNILIFQLASHLGTQLAAAANSLGVLGIWLSLVQPHISTLICLRPILWNVVLAK